MIFKFDKGFKQKNAHGDWVPVNLCEIRGTSQETKPTSRIAEGSVFIEIDTGNVYFFDGANWNKF